MTLGFPHGTSSLILAMLFYIVHPSWPYVMPFPIFVEQPWGACLENFSCRHSCNRFFKNMFLFLLYNKFYNISYYYYVGIKSFYIFQLSANKGLVLNPVLLLLIFICTNFHRTIIRKMNYHKIYLWSYTRAFLNERVESIQYDKMK